MSARPRLIRISLGVSAGWLGISMIGDGVPSLLLPHRLLDAGATDATTLGMTTLIGIGLAAAVQPVAGAWSDRIGRFRVVAIGTGLATTGLLILVSTSAMLAGAVLALVGASVAQAGYQPMLPDRVPVRWRGRAGGLKGAFDVGGAMLGFVLLGGLLGSGRAVAAGPVLIAALAAGFAISAILLGRASPPMPRVERRAPSTGPLLRVVAARFLFLLGIYAVGRFLVMYAAARFGLSADAAAAEAGVTLAVLAGVTVAASVPGGWLADRFGRRAVMVVGGLVGGAGVALVPMTDSMAALLAAGSLMAIGSASFGSASWALLADLSPSPRAGGLLGLANLGTAGAAAAAGAFGPIIDLAGFGVAFALAAACSVASAIVAATLSDRAARPMLAAPAEGAS